LKSYCTTIKKFAGLVANFADVYDLNTRMVIAVAIPDSEKD